MGFVGLCEANPDVFLSHFLFLTSFYPIIGGLECYCCTWSHSVTHTHTHTHTHKSVRCRDLYLTTSNIYTGQTSMPSLGFAPAIPGCELSRPFLGESFNPAGTTLHSWVKFSLNKRLCEIYARLYLTSHCDMLVKREVKTALLWQGQWRVAFQYSHVLGSTCFCIHIAVTDRLDEVRERQQNTCDPHLCILNHFFENIHEISSLEARSTG